MPVVSLCPSAPLLLCAVGCGSPFLFFGNGNGNGTILQDVILSEAPSARSRRICGRMVLSVRAIDPSTTPPGGAPLRMTSGGDIAMQGRSVPGGFPSAPPPLCSSALWGAVLPFPFPPFGNGNGNGIGHPASSIEHRASSIGLLAISRTNSEINNPSRNQPATVEGNGTQARRTL